MAWERRGSGLYYYRARREGGRVVKVYLGSRATGAMAAEADDLGRAERARKRSESASELAALLEPLDAAALQAEKLDRALSAMVAESLAVRGYYLHRGEWRRRRRHEQRGR